MSPLVERLSYPSKNLYSHHPERFAGYEKMGFSQLDKMIGKMSSSQKNELAVDVYINCQMPDFANESHPAGYYRDNMWFTYFSQPETVAALSSHLFDHDVAGGRNEVLENFVSTSLGKLYFDEYENGDEKSLLVSQKIINPLTAWYTERAYANLDRILDRPVPAAELAFLGLIYGKFEEDNPQAEEYRNRLFPLLTESDPPVLLERLRPKDYQSRQKLEKLRRHWKNYLLHYIAEDRLLGKQKVDLSPGDINYVAGALGPDNRLFDNFGSAQNHGLRTALRTGDDKDYDYTINLYRRETSKLEQQSWQAKVEARDSLNDLIQIFDPKLHHLSGPWESMTSKANLILQRFIELRQDLKTGDLTAVEGYVDNFADEIKTYFGPGSVNDASLMKTAVLVYGALMYAGNTKLKQQAAGVASRYLNPLLDQLLLTKTEPVITVQKLPEYQPEAYEPELDKALLRMQALSLNDGIAIYDHEELLAKVEARTAEYRDKMDLLSKLNPNLWSAILMTSISVNVLATILAGIVFGQLLIKDLPQEIKPEEAQLFLVQLLAVIAFNTLISFKSGRKTFPITSAKNTAHVSHADYEQVMDEVIEKGPKEADEFNDLTIKSAFLLTMLYIGTYGGASLGKDILTDRLAGLELRLNADDPEHLYSKFALPELDDKESLRNERSKLIGRMLNQSGQGALQDGVFVGYMPTGFIDRLRSESFLNPPYQKINYQHYDNYRHIDYQPADDEFLVRLEFLAEKFYPPQHMEVVQIFQKGGAAPIQGSLGEIAYPQSQLPEEVTLVLKQTEPMDRWAAAYKPWEEVQMSSLFFHQDDLGLENRRELQQLQLELVTRTSSLINDYKSGLLTEAMLEERYTQAAIEYADKFYDYSQKRYYSLESYGSGKIGPSYLAAMTSGAEAGYYCTVANLGFAEFMRPAGFRIINQLVLPLRHYDSKLYTRFYHMNSFIILPSGKVVYYDMTPSQPKPGEDLSMLDEMPPFSIKEKLARVVMAGTAIMGVGYLALKRRQLAGLVKRKTLKEKIGAILPEEDQAAYGILSAVEHMLVYAEDHSNRQHKKTSPKRAGQRLAHDAVRLLVKSGKGNKPAATKMNWGRAGRPEARVVLMAAVAEIEAEADKYRSEIKGLSAKLEQEYSSLSWSQMELIDKINQAEDRQVDRLFGEYQKRSARLIEIEKILEDQQTKLTLLTYHPLIAKTAGIIGNTFPNEE